MVVKQNAEELAHEYPLATEVVNNLFYVNDCLAGADDVETALTLPRQLQNLFAHSGFVLK